MNEIRYACLFAAGIALWTLRLALFIAFPIACIAFVAAVAFSVAP